MRFTVLCELGGAEEAGDPERLLDAFQCLVVGREVGLGKWQLQVARRVGQAGVLLALERKAHIERAGTATRRADLVILGSERAAVMHRRGRASSRATARFGLILLRLFWA